MKKVKIGVMGAYRGSSMINYCEASSAAQVVAICDKWQEALEIQKKNLNDENITYYNDFNDFIKHDMDAVVLANYANEHAPFAIKCLERGLHVFSEVLPCQCMKEAVELVEAVERSGLVYAYGENYCYMPATREMKKLYREGKIGEIEYAQGEYIHNCEPVWHSITYGEKDHWRNNIYSTFYCTHSLGPLIHISGLRPVSVTGIESTKNARGFNVGSKGAKVGIEDVILENGAIIRSIHGGLYKGSVWYSVYGDKGRMESARYAAANDDVHRIYVDSDDYPGAYGTGKYENYLPKNEDIAKYFGHGGSDYYCMDEFIKKINNDPNADTIDVYEALDMFLPGLFAFRSILDGGKSLGIPNLRNKQERDKYRNDTACTDPNVAGDMLLPTTSHGTPDIPDEIYDEVKRKWEYELSHDRDYINLVTSHADIKKK